MTGTDKNIMSAITNGGRGSSTEDKLDLVLDRLNQVTDRLSEIEMILNNPMHGIDMPEGVEMNIDPAGVGFDGQYVDSAGNNLAFTTNQQDPTYIDKLEGMAYDLVDFDSGVQLKLNLGEPNDS